jgi:hypothetical protein
MVIVAGKILTGSGKRRPALLDDFIQGTHEAGLFAQVVDNVLVDEIVSRTVEPCGGRGEGIELRGLSSVASTLDNASPLLYPQFQPAPGASMNTSSASAMISMRTRSGLVPSKARSASSFALHVGARETWRSHMAANLRQQFGSRNQYGRDQVVHTKHPPPKDGWIPRNNAGVMEFAS